MRAGQPLSKQGSALLLALVTIVVLSSLLMSFLFRMQLEEEVAAFTRFSFKARELARGGQDVGKWMLIRASKAVQEDNDSLGEELDLAFEHLNAGLPLIGITAPGVEEGACLISIRPESSWRNVNLLADADWEQLLEESDVPQELHAGLVDHFRDWTDADDQNRLLGAENDDVYYEDKGITVKNGPLTTLSELGLIKGFTPAILYGGSLEDFYNRPEDIVNGIMSRLTVHGEGRINLSSAPADVLMTIPGIREDQVEELLEARFGPDGIPNTEDDGLVNVAQALSAAGIASAGEGAFTTSDFSWVRIQSIGLVGDVRQGVEAVYEFDGRNFSLHSYVEFTP